MVFLTRREHFCAAHKLWRKEWSEKKNLAVFGKCANPNWHGHNYYLDVTVKGKINPMTGYVIDLHILQRIITEKIIRQVDHKNLNLDVRFMKGKLASSENLAVGIWNQLLPELKKHGAALHCVKISETGNNFVEYYG